MKLRHFLVFAAFSFLAVSCDSNKSERILVTKQPSTTDQQVVEKQLTDLANRVQALELFTATYTAGGPTAFSDCSVLTASEKKTCQIATSVFDAGSQELRANLAAMAKEFQNTLYGTDCINTTDGGCPVAGSLLSNMAAAQANLATHSIDIAGIKSSIASMQTVETSLTSRVTTLEGRLNSFNGTAQSIETIITGIKGDITSLQNDVADLKGVISPSRMVNQYAVCGNIADAGPLYEVLLISGDKKNAYASVKNGSFYGTALFFKAGDTDTAFPTHLGTKTCNFKMYNDTAKTKVQACWVPTNRAATEAQINAARTADTATCTPY